MLTLFLQATFIIFVLVSLLWIWSVAIKNVSIVDIFWGIGFVIILLVGFILNILVVNIMVWDRILYLIPPIIVIGFVS